MRKIALAALAATTTLATPRAVHAAPRADASDDPKAMVAQIQQAWAAFKEKNDEDLKAAVKDVVRQDEIDKINASLNNLQTALDEQSRTIAAGRLDGGEGALPIDPEYNKTFASFLRDGTRETEEKLKSANREKVRAALTEGTNSQGGFLAPVEWDRSLERSLKLISPMRQEATVQTIGGAGFTKTFNDGAWGSGWVGETAARPETSTPAFTSLDFKPGELYANAAATQVLLEDAEVDLGQWIESEIDTEFARQEGIAFISGNGVNKPYGILTYVTGAANAARHPWGAITLVNSGAAAAMTGDGVLNLMAAVPAVHRAGSKFFTNLATVNAVRKLKDGQNNYLWYPAVSVEQQATLGGYPIVDMPDMPDVAAAAVPLLFGNMKTTYLVVDRRGFTVLRDPYTNKPFIMFYCTKRVGGGVKNPQAMKGQLISA